MVLTEEIHYHHVFQEGYQAVRLPYMDSSVDAILILPDADSFPGDLYLGPGAVPDLKTGVKDFTPRLIRLYVPKYRIKTNEEFKETLIEMGMVDAFYADRQTGRPAPFCSLPG